MSEIIAVVSGDGGSGKTMFAANLASVIAVSGYKVLLLDMNTRFSDLDIVLGLEEKVQFDITDVITGNCTVKKALVRSGKNKSLYLLPASRSGDMSALTEKLMKKMCTRFVRDFDYVIIDLPEDINDAWKAAVSQTRKMIIMLTPEYSSLREAEVLNRALDENSSAQKFAVINKFRGDYHNDENFPSVETICSTLDIPVIGGIVYDEAVHLSMNSGVPVTADDDNYISRNFKRIFLRMYSRM